MLEFSTPVWTSDLNQAEERRSSKICFAIILDEKYKSYAKALTYLNRVTLSTCRSELNLNFAKKCLKSEKYQHWFKLNKPPEKISKTRSVDDNLLVPVQSRTKGFLKSPIAYLTNLINMDNKK